MGDTLDKHFLIIEENPDDAFLIKHAFRAVPFCSAFVSASIGDARAYLTHAGIYADTYLHPNGVLVNLNVGGEFTFEFIDWVSRELSLPVFGLSGGISPARIAQAISAGTVEVVDLPSSLHALRVLLSSIVRRLCSAP